MFGLLGSKAPEVMTDGKIFSKFRELTEKTVEEIVIVSPYLDPPADVVRLLKNSVSRGVQVDVLFREDKMAEYASKPWLAELAGAGVNFGALPLLHAKLYVFDGEHAIVTSMNLVETSWSNSRELGLLVPFSNELNQFLDQLEKDAQAVGPNPRSASRRSRSQKSPPARADGFCIRCATAIALNPDRPYCREHYEKWAEYSNPDYKDKFCHGCGKSSPATMSKPLCSKCYAAAR